MKQIELLISRAEQTFEDANYLFFERKSYESAISRAYYAIFYTTEAMLFSKSLATSSHKGLSIEFAKNFIKTNEIEPIYGKILSNIFQKRQFGDYDMYAEITESIANEVLKDAAKFIGKMKEYLSEKEFL
jgi:uncharacterized protein (UPF0332 family)